MRPELDGNRIQEVLGIGPGREVGEAYRFLLDIRLDEGRIGEETSRASDSRSGGRTGPDLAVSPAPGRGIDRFIADGICPGWGGHWS